MKHSSYVQKEEKKFLVNGFSFVIFFSPLFFQ